ncbi:MAG: T9SS type A sorting domain-containing protein [candidate division Zixibacteria bacterium]
MNAFWRIAIITCFCISGLTTAFAQWSEPVPVVELNDIGSEFFPYLSADGQILLFMAEGTITMSRWDGDSWGEREYLPSPINYIGLQSTSAAITPDLEWIYWVSWRAGGMGMWDIWRSHWDDDCDCWGEAELLGPNINSPDIEWGMCFTSDGTRMYFVTDTPYKNGQYSQGDMDIWYSDWDSVTGDWGLPNNIGYPVNFIDREYAPYVSADGNTLYFTCWGAHGVPYWQGEEDIFKATWDGSNWTNVENMRPPINSEVEELGSAITPDNRTFYFSSRRDGDPNGDYELMKSTWDPTGIEEGYSVPRNNDVKIDAFPNPFNNSTKITIWSETSRLSTISIYNILGEKVYGETAIINEHSYSFNWSSIDNDGSSLSSGLYFLRVNDSKNIYKTKLLKIK